MFQISLTCLISFRIIKFLGKQRGFVQLLLEILNFCFERRLSIFEIVYLGLEAFVLFLVSFLSSLVLLNLSSELFDHCFITSFQSRNLQIKLFFLILEIKYLLIFVLLQLLELFISLDSLIFYLILSIHYVFLILRKYLVLLLQ